MSLYVESADPPQMELFTSMDYYQDDARLIDSLLFDEASFDDLDPDAVEHGNDWIDSFLKDRSNYLLSDCMMSMSPTGPCVQSEHSYSMATSSVSSPDVKIEPDLELEPDSMDAVNPNLTMSSVASTLAQDAICPASSTAEEFYEPIDIKPELFVSDEECCVTEAGPEIIRSDTEVKMEPSSLYVETTTSPPPTFVVTRKVVRQQPTIIVTRAHHQLVPYQNSSIVARLSQTKMQNVACGIIKEVGSSCSGSSSSTVDTALLLSTTDCHSNYEESRLPPTPPGSNYSDSEASRSPKASPPSSPQQHSWTQRLQQMNSPSITANLPMSGVLILTDEEKRTLIAEGYPVPTRLPLTKQEEKNLKKVQRKIKNKMSAQESRRKKKDYVETLEKKLEESNQENSQLKQRMESLESDNRTLMQKLQKLQSLASTLLPSSPLQSSTCLMVFGLFFALCFGAWGPTTLPLSWPMANQGGKSLSSASSSDFIGAKLPTISDYSTPNVRARTLKFFEDTDVSSTESPSVYHNALLGWFSGFCRPQPPDARVPSSAVEEPGNETTDEAVDDRDNVRSFDVVTDENIYTEVRPSQDSLADKSEVDDVDKSTVNENATRAAKTEGANIQMEVYTAEIIGVMV